MSDVLLKVDGLYKKFCKSLRRSMLYGTHDMVRSMLGHSIEKIELRKSEFWALQDINFELKRGETLGLIGLNGCGKTTLLRLINGIFPPDTGRITINGRIGALIAVGAGFHPHMTGRENIYLNGIILGMTRHEIRRKFDEIVGFAEIGDFIDAPVSTYSSGMTVRLGFAIAIHCEPDILLIDEILAVGDAEFQLKCFNKLGELKSSGVGTLFVSHDMHTISTFSNQILLLQKGRQIFLGNAAEGLSIYKKSITTLKSAGKIEKIKTGTDYFKIIDVVFEPVLSKDSIINISNLDDLICYIHYDSTLDLNNVGIDYCIDVPFPVPHFFFALNSTFKQKLDIKKGKGVLRLAIKGLTLNNINSEFHITVWRDAQSEILFWWTHIPVVFTGNALSTGWSHFNMEFSNIQ